MKILLVEDDIDLGNVLAQYLKFQTFDVNLARSGEEGLDEFRKNDVDLCIFDIMLPGMNGLILAGKIKQIDQNIPLIFLTARSSKEDVLEGLKLGADYYICNKIIPK